MGENLTSNIEGKSYEFLTARSVSELVRMYGLFASLQAIHLQAKFSQNICQKPLKF